MSNSNEADPASALDRKQLQRAIETAAIGSWELAGDRCSLFCSRIARAQHGVAADAPLTPDSFRATFVPEDRERWDAAVDTAAGGSPVTLRCRVRWEDETLHWIELRIAAHPLSTGGMVLTGVSQNIDELVRVKERLELLDAIGEATRQASEADRVMAISCELLGCHLSATRVAYADVFADNDRFRIRHDWTDGGAVSTVGEYSLALFGSRAVAELAEGRPLVVRNVDAELPAGDGANMFNAIGIKAIICCSLVKDGKLLAMMAVHQSTPRQWLDEDVALVQSVVDRCWAHIERIRFAEELQAHDRAKDEFLATLSHELRNPLASISMGLNLWDRTTAGDDLDRVTGVVRRQVGHLVRLVDDLLDIARIRRGLLILQKSSTSLQDAINDGLDTTRAQVEAANQVLVLDLPTDVLRVYGDATRLAQIVANLVNNAAKYTARGGTITVGLRAQGAHGELTVRDNGMGMEASLLPTVFDIFEQGRGTRHRAQGGLGIGLAVVRKLVELHGGTVHAASAGEGQGSCFTVRLPLLTDAEPLLPVQTRPPAAVPRRILVVEDNVDGGDMLVAALEAQGHDVALARDGSSGLRLAQQFAPAVVLLDLGLPDQSGLDVGRALRADPKTASVRIIALTGWGSELDRELTRAAGFDAHLTKPVDLEVLNHELASQPRTERASS